MDTITVLFSYAISQHVVGNISEAGKTYRQILELDSTNVTVLNNLGLISSQSEKINLFCRAIELHPEYFDARFNLAIALDTENRHSDAFEHYSKMMQIINDLFTETKWEEGIAKLELLLQRKPGFNEGKISIAQAYLNLGAYQQQIRWRFDLAIESFRRALHHNPAYHTAHDNIIFTQNFITGMDTAQQQQERASWNKAYALQYASPEYWRTGSYKHLSGRKKRLRVGYVSGNFIDYAATYAFAPLILNYNSDAYDVICYADNQSGDSITEMLKNKATHWREIALLDDEAVARRIADDGIDILVDCAGFQKGNRLLVFARKPAPIQVTGWGEPTGTGLTAMDYLLADKVLVPENERHLFAETVVDLPCFLGYWTPEQLPEPGPLPVLASGHFTFGSFNRGAKHSDVTLALWAKVLNAVPYSRLLLKAPDWDRNDARIRLLDRFAHLGGSPERLDFLGFMTRANHFDAYRSVDFCLDPQPHSGGMTTLDALYMGLPVLTLPGATPSARLASAVLSALGLSEWIADDETEFVAKAAAFAADLSCLSLLRGQLRSRMCSSAIGNSSLYAKTVEDEYRKMWNRWCDNNPCIRN